MAGGTKQAPPRHEDEADIWESRTSSLSVVFFCFFCFPFPFCLFIIIIFLLVTVVTIMVIFILLNWMVSLSNWLKAMISSWKGIAIC